MSERPVLFSAPMVRAILAGTKTQTRRVVKPQPTEQWDDGAGTPKLPRAPWHPGWRLWVRETWAHDAESVEACRAAHEDMHGGDCGPYYRATETAPDTLRWRPSIHMPRWASRLTLAAKDVRVERVQAITEADAKAEGVPRGGDYGNADTADATTAPFSHRRGFAHLWDSINGKRPGCSWAANPWVWVVSFEVLP